MADKIVELKLCPVCNQMKDRKLDFYAKQSCCKECTKAKQRAYNEAHRAQINQRQRAYNATHKEEQSTYREAHKDENNAKSRQYYQEHREEILAQKAQNKHRKAIYDRLRRLNKQGIQLQMPQTPKQKYRKTQLSQVISSGMRKALQQNKAGRHWEEFVPYNLAELKEHLESQFTEGMSWDNFGEYWEIDHIIPQNLFSISSVEDHDFKICWSLMNLRPLSVTENRSRPKDGSDVPECLSKAILSQVIE